MALLLVSFVFSLILYLALTAGSGSYFLYWSLSELLAGVVFSVLAALLAGKLLSAVGVKVSWAFLSPSRWALFIAYAIGPFLFSMAKANIDVAGRVITGRIRPGIVKVETGLKNDFGLALLANSITLTPGTLSVDADEKRNLYVHCIHLRRRDPEPEEVCGPFVKWARRISE
jgi:multicomponent Na+:H+ antiporter subunit E